MNKKSLMIATLSLGLAFTAGSSFAADLSNGFGTRCDGTGSWHFVNPQTGGASTGAIDVYFANGACTTPVVTDGPSKVNNNNIHFRVTSTGDCTLDDAMTNLPGRLVLSDYMCTDIKK